MFKSNDVCYYVPSYMKHGLEVAPIEARFIRVKEQDNKKAVILVKDGTEFKKRRTVNLTSLQFLQDKPLKF